MLLLRQRDSYYLQLNIIPCSTAVECGDVLGVVGLGDPIQCSKVLVVASLVGFHTHLLHRIFYIKIKSNFPLATGIF